MSGSFESVRRNACVHRLDLGLYSYPKGFWGNGVRNHVNSKGKKSLLPEAQRRFDTRKVASRSTASPTYYRLSYSGPQFFHQNGVDAMDGFLVPVEVSSHLFFFYLFTFI